MIKHDFFYPKGQVSPLELYIYIPNTNVSMDVLYLLDGENAFRDHLTVYGRALRLQKKLDYVNINTPLMAVAISAGDDRTNLYSPFKIKNAPVKDWLNNDTSVAKKFSNVVVNELISYVDSKYNTNKGKSHRYIYGSSLAAIEALYLGLNYRDSFSYIGAFSTASFIYDEEFNKFIKKQLNKEHNIFLYVGEKEESDGAYDSKIYLDSSLKLYNEIKDKCNSKLMINKIGTHSEKSWSTYILDFISFIYKSKAAIH